MRLRCASTLPPLALLLPLLAGCGAGGADAPAAQRETLPDGSVLIRYAALPTTGLEPLQPDLVIGAMDGEPHEVFGDIRGVDADEDGTIYVLDTQASEVRAFDRDGNFRATIVRQGGGPGEIRRANGLRRTSDGTLWLQDTQQRVMIGVGRNGEEVGRFPSPVQSWGYIWEGVRDERGRWWWYEPSTDIPEVYPPPDGVHEWEVRLYQIAHHPESGASDSILLGQMSSRSVIATIPPSTLFMAVPFEQEVESIVDPAGGFWTVAPDAYRVTRLDEQGNPLVVIEVELDPPPVTDADRATFLARATTPERADVFAEVFELAPAFKRHVEGLMVDDEGRLWVRRSVPDGEPPILDLFARDGTWLTTLRLGVIPALQMPLRVRNGALLTVTTDSLDVPRVVRIPLPAGVGGEG